MADFSQKIVVVTGCASGIGKAQAERFLQSGALVYGFDCQSSSIEHERFIFQQLDLTDETAVQSIHLAADILCNTAGILDDFQPTLQTSVQQWRRVLDSNVTSMFLMTNQLLPAMIEKQKGIIINMASIASLIPGGGGAAYTASKHAVLGYTKQLVHDYARLGIRINAIAPGAIDTPMNAADFADDAAIAHSVMKQIPQNRYASAEEVADLTLFLASDAAQYICGDIIPIDGGWINRDIPL